MQWIVLMQLTQSARGYLFGSKTQLRSAEMLSNHDRTCFEELLSNTTLFAVMFNSTPRSFTVTAILLA